jgi:hypothetical protein
LAVCVYCDDYVLLNSGARIDELNRGFEGLEL